jgi:ubiquinone biosynthesis protein
MAAGTMLLKTGLLRSIPRLLQILRVLIRHKFLGALRGRNHFPTPKEVRETFEELGLTFLKLGQVLALRRDLLPDTYIAELEQLLDQLPALEFQSVRTAIEAELRLPVEAVFSSFSETPLGAATIAQVHEATTHDGRRVVVKVQRPDLKTMIATDIAALNRLVAIVEALFPRLRALDLPVVVSEFADSLELETDFTREARSITIFRLALKNIPEIWIPSVVAEYSTGVILTMEYAEGERVDIYAQQNPDAMPRLISILAKVMLQTIFEEGLFHADPHPGNLLVMPDGRLCLIDFGMTGELDEPMRNSLTYLLEAVVKKDSRAATESYLEMTRASEKVNRSALMIDMKAVLQEIHRTELSEVSIGEAFAALLRAGSRHGVHNPGEFFLLTRVFVIMESMMRRLDPKFDFMKAFHEEIKRLAAQRFDVEQVKERTRRVLHELDRLMNEGPGDLRRSLRRISEGNLGSLQAPAIEALGGRISRILKRLVATIISWALISGGSLLVHAPRDTGWHHYYGEAMVAAGVAGSILVLLSLLRGDRGRGRSRR